MRLENRQFEAGQEADSQVNRQGVAKDSNLQEQGQVEEVSMLRYKLRTLLIVLALGLVAWIAAGIAFPLLTDVPPGRAVEYVDGPVLP